MSSSPLKTRSPGRRPSVNDKAEDSGGGGGNSSSSSGSSAVVKSGDEGVSDTNKANESSFNDTKDSSRSNYGNPNNTSNAANIPSSDNKQSSSKPLSDTDHSIQIQVHDRAPSDCSKYDICIVIPLPSESKRLGDSSINLLEHLAVQFGMECLYLYESLVENLCFLLIRGSVSKLKVKAERDKFMMLLDPVVSREMLYYYSNDEKIEISHNLKLSTMKPYECAFGRYRSEIEFQSLYWRPEKAKNPFSKSIRLQLIFKMISDPSSRGGANINLDSLIRENVISSYFPIHDTSEIEDFKSNFVSLCRNPFNQPIKSIREYFGEKIALVYALYEHFILYVSLPLIVGIVFQILIILKQDKQFISGYFYSFILMIWAIITLAYWKQNAASQALSSGTLNNQIDEVVRSRFEGRVDASVIDGSDTLYHSPRRGFCYFSSFFLIIAFIASMGLAAVVSLYVIKKQIEITTTNSKFGDGYLQNWFTSIITGAVVFAGNYVYYYFAIVISSWENHRTVSSYKRSFSVKVALFQFINNFASFYYLSFIAPFMAKRIANNSAFMDKCGDGSISSSNSISGGGDGSDSCIPVLYINLVTVYGVQIILKNICFYLIPAFFSLISKLVASYYNRGDDFSLIKCIYSCFGCSTATAYNNTNTTTTTSSSSTSTNTSSNNNSDLDRSSDKGYCHSISNCFKKTDSSVNTHHAADFGVEVYDIYSGEATIAGGLDASGTDAASSPKKRNQSSYFTSDDVECMPELDYYLKSWDSENSLSSNATCSSSLCENLSFCETSSLYAEIGLSLGYLLLFASVLPGVVVLFWIDVFLMQRRHAWRLFNVYRRPIPDSQSVLTHVLFNQSENKVWEELYICLIFIAFITNSGLLCFVLPAIQPVELNVRIWLFFGFQCLLLSCQYFVSLIVPEVSDKVRIQFQRSQFISSKLIERDLTV